MKKLFLTLALAAATVASYGQGTIGFVNGTLTRVTYNGANLPVDVRMSFGAFFGTTAADVQQKREAVLPLGTNSAVAGIFAAPGGNNYQLPGTNPGDIVFLQIKAWESRFSDYETARAQGGLYGQTDIRQIAALGPSTGPGTVIWQGATGVNPARFNPLVIVPEPSAIALGVLGLGSLLLFRRRK